MAGNRKALGQLSAAGVSGDPSGALPLQLRLAYVAAGRLDGAVSVGNRNDWDLAAGELLVREAGGRVSTTAGEACVYNRAEPWQQGLVAAGPVASRGDHQCLEGPMTTAPAKSQSQLIHLVFGGELDDIKGVTFKDLAKLDVVGFYPNYAEAHKAWLGKARETIDNAQMRYFIVHMHRLLDPPATGGAEEEAARRSRLPFTEDAALKQSLGLQRSEREGGQGICGFQRIASRPCEGVAAIGAHLIDKFGDRAEAPVGTDQVDKFH